MSAEMSGKLVVAFADGKVTIMQNGILIQNVTAANVAMNATGAVATLIITASEVEISSTLDRLLLGQEDESSFGDPV